MTSQCIYFYYDLAKHSNYQERKPQNVSFLGPCYKKLSVIVLGNIVCK